MLIGIDPLLTPDLLWALGSMGHGDDLALVDANHPAEAIAASTGRPLIHMPGLALDDVARAILGVLPIDVSEPDPARCMAVVGDPGTLAPVQVAVQAVLSRATSDAHRLVGVERHAFYAAARKAFVVVQVGDARRFGCFLFRKGVIAR
ncbi:MAG: RbsD/FucU family protein [Lautropia sp.]